jgi:hypothetical protein
MAGVGFYSLFVSFEGKLQVIVGFATDFILKGGSTISLSPVALSRAKSIRIEE